MSTITVEHLTKRYGGLTALDDPQFQRATWTDHRVPRGDRVRQNNHHAGTAGPVRAGVRTGADRRSALRDIDRPSRVVGAVLDQGFHPNRTARNHLRIVAALAGVSRSRIDQVLGLVGLSDAAARRVGGFSLGMRQRLALATAMIGEPSILVLDEPFNGLDPDGIMTMRTFFRRFADDGGTVFLSSHLLAEIAHSADDVIIIDHGRLVTAGAISELTTGTSRVSVASTDADLLAITLASRRDRRQCGRHRTAHARRRPGVRVPDPHSSQPEPHR